jgi:hypothetical protein
MNDLAGALAILSAMITPAVLILACGSLTLATSQRLGRIIERTRRISNQFKELARNRTDQAMLEEERVLLFNQLGRATRRAPAATRYDVLVSGPQYFRSDQCGDWHCGGLGPKVHMGSDPAWTGRGRIALLRQPAFDR